MTKRLRVACAIIENEEGHVLLAERPAGKHLAGFLEFPGGKIEAGESAESALRRELREELCLDVDVHLDLGEHSYDYGEFIVELRTFVVRAIGAPRATLDVHRFYWRDPHALDLKSVTPADHEPWRAYLNLTRGEYS